MKKIINIKTLLFIAVSLCFFSCKKDYGNLNSPTEEEFLKNANKDQLNNLVSGTESALRNNLALYLDDIGVIGREIYRFSPSDPRYTTDLLGAADAQLSNTGFYIVNTWASRYRVVKNCNLLIDAAANSTFITDAERKGYSGFAKTIKAYQLLLLLNLTNNNGIRIDVSDPDNPGPVVMHDEALVAIAALLNEGNVELGSAQVSFPLSSGFVAFNNAAGLAKVNRALAARVAVYQKQWATALTALNESFYSLNGNFNVGVFDVFGNGSGDQLNPAFIPQNQAGEVRVAHPSFSSEIEPNDNRIAKATPRNAPASNSGLSSDRDVWVYTSSTAPVPIVRNEELILINAEANIQLNNLQPAVNAINIIRKGHSLPDYNGALTQQALIDEMLKQRRYSLFFEGHRWVDLRRYNRLATLPVDRAGDDVWVQFPLPNTEL